jgi:hypothetical protein
MFHVSTMLPYSKKDSQQIERKRHLGNDAVLIVFHDGATPFQPQCITSKYSQVRLLARVRDTTHDTNRANGCSRSYQIYMVVQAIKQEGGETMYRLGVASREDVPEYGPPLPNPPVFPAGSQARDFIFKKSTSPPSHFLDCEIIIRSDLLSRSRYRASGERPPSKHEGTRLCQADCPFKRPRAQLLRREVPQLIRAPTSCNIISFSIVCTQHAHPSRFEPLL